MSSLPNSHEALLRNRDLLGGTVGLLGVTDPGLLSRLGEQGLAMSEHAGVYEALSRVPGWQACFGYDAPGLQPASLDTIVVFLPKARAELDLRLALALWLAGAGARLILVGEKKEGIAGAVKQLRASLPDAGKVDSARHCQVWSAEITEPAPEFALADWITWTQVEHAGVSIDVAGMPGIFSHGELDEGTALLLDSLAREPVSAGRLLDFACGAGVIGSWLQGWQRQSDQTVSRVDGLDVQSQAVICARATYERNGCAGDIHASDGLAGIEGKWPAIVTNPPFHTGVRTDTSMTERFLQDVASHLEAGGELRLVANSFLPYEELIRRHVGAVERLEQTRRFTVYRAFRR
ncbi:class I SAM-dependent methyltransferase [Marinobacter pelagius]|uniref:Ribosomal RNA small subunit methyltransferase C n=1 Tax=Marinobacter pelagius TaxID=379482 RepID=A0A1I4TRI8_9GAMM|nr:class I SAM-dependent methyltransferase [Marinobacter pelagius]SFM79279.1 16S rRNA m(2)G 1207 methyltransferase [Marinobacter pelagius]